MRGSLAAVALFAACSSSPPEALPITAGQIEKDIPTCVVRQFDILFVIDNSASMAEEQASLARNFPAFINVLENIQGGLPSVHIGVISTDVGIGGYQADGCQGGGDEGRLRLGEDDACPMIQGGRFIEDIPTDSGPTKNYTGTLEDAFACIAHLGTSGCNMSQPLQSMEEALAPGNAVNAGFLRPDAYLMVVFITDEDDCSARDSALFDPADTSLGRWDSYRCTAYADSYLWQTQHYVDFLKSLKRDPHQLVVSTVAGNPTPVVVGTDSSGNPALEPSCESANALAYPAVRLNDFQLAFGANGTFVSICNSDLTDALNRIAQTSFLVIGNTCLEGNIDPTDLDPEQPGIQLDCAVTSVTYPWTSLETQTVVPRCPMISATQPDLTRLPCWWVETDENQCYFTPSHAEVHIERASRCTVVPTHDIVHCATAH